MKCCPKCLQSHEDGVERCDCGFQMASPSSTYASGSPNSQSSNTSWPNPVFFLLLGACIFGAYFYFYIPGLPETKARNAILTDSAEEMISISGSAFLTDEVIQGTRFLSFKMSDELPWERVINSLVQSGDVKIQTNEMAQSTDSEILKGQFRNGKIQTFILIENLLSRNFAKVMYLDFENRIFRVQLVKTS